MRKFSVTLTFKVRHGAININKIELIALIYSTKLQQICQLAYFSAMENKTPDR